MFLTDRAGSAKSGRACLGRSACRPSIGPTCWSSSYW